MVSNTQYLFHGSPVIICCCWVPGSALRVHGSAQKWRAHSEQARRAFGMSADSRPWTGTRRPIGIPLLARAFDVVDTAYGAWLARHPDASEQERNAPDLFIDWTQATQRIPSAEGHPLGAHQSNGDFSFEANRCLVSQDRKSRLRASCCFRFPTVVTE